MQKTLMIDPAKCSGCRICEAACSFGKIEACAPAQSRIKIVKYEAQGIAIPIVCAHCKEPPCQWACPLDIIAVDPFSGRVVTREEACVGCKACMVACIYGAVSYDPARGVAVHCDHCDGDPLCVKYCPTGALQYVPVELADMPGRRQMASRLSEAAVAARGF